MGIPDASSTDREEHSTRRVRVLLPLPLAGAFEYRAPPSLALIPGDFVRVPLGKRTHIGVVWDHVKTDDKNDSTEVDDSRLRDIEARLDTWPMTDSMRQFIDWVAGYSMVTPGAVLRMAISIPEALQPGRPRIVFQLNSNPPNYKPTVTRARVVAELTDGPARTAADLARDSGTSVSVIRGLTALGVLDAVQLSDDTPLPQPDPSIPGPTLSLDQSTAAAELVAKTQSQAFSVTLLDGVTGAGKTEVYLEAVAAALGAGKQVLILLPEIALTAQFLQRFKLRFGATPQEWHSDMPRAQRRRVWRAIADGRARVVVGARSSLFLPFRELGLLIVDEEHDPSYKQEEGVIYHARDMAVVRARLQNSTIVLASATPSLETVTNVNAGRYTSQHLPSRHGSAELPKISVVDLRHDPPERNRWIAPTLKKALAETLSQKEQSLLFLNRRGYAPLTLCRACGHRLECPQCTSWLVEHRFAGQLACHHCGYITKKPVACPDCKTENRMVACGPGVERLFEEIGSLFPDARVELMTSDTIGSPLAAVEVVRRVQAHEIDILIGTQLVAKGHHFPKLTLVGVVDADLGLNGGDLRATERTYQLLHQVAGRAGREARPGRVLLQTHHPDHPVIAALNKGDRDAFMWAEAEQRKAGNWPPFGRLAGIIVSGPNESLVDSVARALARSAPQAQDFKVFGPAPAPLSILRGRHRRRLLVRTTRMVRIQDHLRAWVGTVKPPNSVRIQIDIDPYSFL